MMRDDEIIAVVQAHKEGKALQITEALDEYLTGNKLMSPRTWHCCTHPPWDFVNYDYRIAPEPRKPREWWIIKIVTSAGESVHISEHGGICMSGNYTVKERIRVREVI